MIMRRPYSRTATRRDHPAQDPPNTQVTAAEVKEQAKCLFLNPLGHVGGTRRLCVVADQYRDVDGLAEVVLRADGGPELVGEEWPLVWWGQLVGRDR